MTRTRVYVCARSYTVILIVVCRSAAAAYTHMCITSQRLAFRPLQRVVCLAQSTFSFFCTFMTCVNVCVRAYAAIISRSHFLIQAPAAGHCQRKAQRDMRVSVINALLEPRAGDRSLLPQQQEQAEASERTPSGQPSTGQPFLCDRCRRWFNGPTPGEDHKLGFKLHKNSNCGVSKVSPHHEEKRRRHCHSQVYSICHLSVCLAY